MYSIYCITNKITGKKYVGYTHQPEIRWYQHQFHGRKGTGTCIQLYQSMKKHGVDNFTFDIIEDNIENENSARVREKHFISEYDTFRSGYNATEGGTGGDMSKYDSWKEAMIKCHENKSKESYATYGFSGKSHSTEALQKQSKARKDHWESLSLEDRISRGKKISGSNNGMFGKSPKNSVRILYNGIEYDSLAAASKSTGHSSGFLKKHGEII